MRRTVQFEARNLVRWTLAVLAAGWMLGAVWFSFVQSGPAPAPYASYERQIDKCRSKATSQARYDCTSQLMLAKDNAIFNKTLIILLPPLALLIGYLGVVKAVTGHRDKMKSRAARIASQKRMAEWRGFLKDVKAGTATHQTEDLFLDPARRPSATPPHPARRR